MKYWKLGCRWGKKTEGKPLFFDLLIKENIVISWNHLDFGKDAIILLTDGFAPLGIAKTLSQKRPIKELIDKESDFKEKHIYFEEGLVYYDATIIPIQNPNFSYDAQQGIINIHSNQVIKNIKGIMNAFNKNVQLETTIKLLEYKKQIILQGPPGTGKTRLAKEIANDLISLNKIENQTLKVKVLTTEYIKSNLKENQKIDSKNNKEFEVVELKKNVVLLKSDVSKPWKPSYNKIIDSFNNKLWETKGRTGGFKSYEDAIAKYFYDNHLELIPSSEHNVNNEKDFLKLIQFHPSYTYEDFVRGIVAKPNEDGEGIIYEAENKTLAKFAEMAFDEPDNNYVLIIDEINRANLSSVLGELIYALEYRGEAVESMYAVDDDNQLILPPNLYIIGTMNTADRSVGHIDYAIRRRFAFVDVPPENLKEKQGMDNFNDKLFLAVEKLFQEHTSPEFEMKDVQLGHSYFIDKSNEENGAGMDIRFEYEIKPILLEYVKDGVLIGTDIKNKIEELKTLL